MLSACSEVGRTAQDNASADFGEAERRERLRVSVEEVERRAARNLEVSNTAIAAHIGVLSERLSKVEKIAHGPAVISHDVRPVHPAPLPTPMPAPPAKELEEEARDAEGIAWKEEVQEGVAAKEDPDERQRGYADFIFATQRSLKCVGVHSWSLCASTRVGSSKCRTLCALAPSVLLLLLQIFVLQAIGLESLHPACSRNDQCRAGMWCSPSTGPSGVSTSPGMCDDCAWAVELCGCDGQDFSRLPARYRKDTYDAMTDASMDAAQSHCAVEHNSDPDRCDFLVDFRDQLTIAPFIVFVTTTCLVVLQLVVDMDRQAQVADLFEHRITHVAKATTCAEYLITGVAWLIFNLRKFVLPGALVYTYAALVLGSSPSPGNSGVSLPMSFILNGLGVCFIYNIDSLLAMALLDENAHALIREAFADLDAHVRAGDQVSPLEAHWLPFCFHRFMALFLGGLVLLQVLATESLMDSMPLFRLDWDEVLGNMEWAESPLAKSCTNIGIMLGTTTSLAIALFALVWSITHQVAKTCRRCGPFDVLFAPVVTLATMPLLSYALWKLAYSPM